MRSIELTEWDNLNDIEKQFALERGLDPSDVIERLEKEAQMHPYETEIIPFPLSS